MLHKDDSEDTVSTPMYHIESASVFNLLVLSCLKHVEPCLSIHLPPSQGKSTLSSSHKAWPRVKRIIKPYLSDLHSLIANLRDPAMQCAVIRNIRTLTRCVVCLPRVCKGLEKQLIECWACGDHHVQVMAFLALRDITLIKPHPSLGETLKVGGREGICIVSYFWSPNIYFHNFTISDIHTHTHTHTHTLPHVHTHPPTLPHVHTHARTHSHLLHSPTHSHTHTRPHTHCRNCILRLCVTASSRVQRLSPG